MLYKTPNNLRQFLEQAFYKKKLNLEKACDIYTLNFLTSKNKIRVFAVSILL